MPRDDAAVPLLVKALQDREPKVRAQAAGTLHWSGRSKSATPALIAALMDPDRAVRHAAAWALGTVGPEAQPAILDLVVILRADQGTSRLSAFAALQSIGAPAVPVLLEFVNDPDPALRRGATEAIGRVGPAAKAAMPALLARLDDPVREVRSAVARALAGIGTEAIDPLIRALRHRDPRVRGTSARALAYMRDKASPAIPVLIDALAIVEPIDDPEPPPRQSSGDDSRDEPPPQGLYAVLKDLGAAAIPPLIARLNSPDRRARVLAMRALGFCQDDKISAAIPILIECLGDRDLRLEAAEALGKIAWGDREAIPRLIDGLKDPDPAYRATAAEAIGRIGWESQGGMDGAPSRARGAVTPLIAALKDPIPRVRQHAATALGDIGTEAHRAIPDLVALLKDGAPEVRLAALRSFPMLGGVPVDVRDTVLALLKDSDRRIRLAAATLLRGDALGSETVVAGLLAAMQDLDAEVRAAAVSHFAWMNPQQGVSLDGKSVYWSSQGHTNAALLRSPGAGAAFRMALSDADSRVRAAAAYVLPTFRDEAGASVPLLIARLKDPSVVVRVAAAIALGQFKSEARAAVPALLDALVDPAGPFFNDFSVSCKAAQSLQAISPEATATMTDRLFALLGDADDHVRAEAGAALQDLGPEISGRLFRVLADPKTPRLARSEMLGILAGRYGIDEHTEEEDPVPRGPEAQAAIPVLRSLALDVDPDIALHAIKLLMTLERREDEIARLFLQGVRVGGIREMTIVLLHGMLEPTVLPVFLDALHDPDPEFRADVIHVIAEVGGGRESAMEEYEAAGEEPTPAAREEWARNHRLILPAVDALLPLLKDADPAVRWNAAMTLGRLGAELGRVVPALVEMVKTESGRVPISEHLMARSDLRSEYYPIGSYFLGWSERDGEPLRIAAMQALGMFGPKAAAAVPEFTRILRDDQDPRVFWYTAAAVTELGPEAKAAVPPLIAALRTKVAATGATVGYITYGGVGMSKEDGPVRLAAAVALGKIGADAREAVPELTRALADTDPRVRGEAAAALGAIGPKAAAAVPELARMAVGEEEDLLADLVAKALGEIGAPAVPALISMVRTGKPKVRVRAMTAIGAIGPKADAALPELSLAIDDRDEEIRTAAAEALGAVGSGPKERAAILPLLEALKDEDRIVREQAAKALSQIGARTEEAIPGLIDAMKKTAVPALLESLKDEDPVVRQHAAGALGKIGASTDRVVPALIQAPRDPDRLARFRAVAALEAIGPSAAASLDDLVRLRGDPDEEVRRAAEAAIKAIKPDAPKKEGEQNGEVGKGESPRSP